MDARRRTRAGLLLGPLALAAVAAGCGSTVQRSEGSHQVARAVPQRPRPPAALPRRCVTRSVALGSARTAYAAVVPRQAAALAGPHGQLVARLSHLDVNHVPTVLGVVSVRMDAGCRPLWYRVQLPLPPNGRTAWVAAGSLRVYTVSSRIVVSLSRRRLVLYRAGRAALRATVAIGAPSTPTPAGRFYVNERYVLDDPNGPFGAAALGISAHSTVLKDWVEGGPIALHGTDEPATIGSAVSHGCIRLRNSVVRRLLALTPAGTPVLIEE